MEGYEHEPDIGKWIDGIVEHLETLPSHQLYTGPKRESQTKDSNIDQIHLTPHKES